MLHSYGSIVLGLLTDNLLLISSHCSLALGVGIFISSISELLCWTSRLHVSPVRTFFILWFDASVSLPFLYGIPFSLFTLPVCYCMSIFLLKHLILFLRSRDSIILTTPLSYQLQSCCRSCLFKPCVSLWMYCDFFLLESKYFILNKVTSASMWVCPYTVNFTKTVLESIPPLDESRWLEESEVENLSSSWYMIWYDMVWYDMICYDQRRRGSGTTFICFCFLW